ncbi:MAG TPA: MBL fold metallo-hydrolase [Candidatus Choladousia intestinavium]|uniref:MBL fold metallo-hydrolase n=1 Tax=Candidatus Choladousia intestinavium TaxID=2840727 RepID=A0A9D1ADD3_9FIRM|nr:MBL fold metallo-hydrolase [Candidatus Choladousia intestinavium]
MGELRIETMVLGMVGTNCYLAVNQKTKELLILDPADDGVGIQKRITDLGAAPAAVLLTHGHFDHIGAAQYLRDTYRIPVCAMETEREVLEDPAKNLTAMSGQTLSLKADRFFKDGEEAELAGFSIRVIHTPGHTAGGCCYYFPDEGVLFSGDTLFAESIGRTDFPTGSMGTLVRSIQEKLFGLPDETKVYPGHGEETQIRWEKRYNPFCRS